MKTTIKLLPLLLCCACAAAQAGTPINQTRPLDARGHLSIENVKGAVTVRVWDRNQVRVTGTLGDGAQPLVVSGNADDLHIKVEGPQKSGWFNWGSDSRMGPTTLDVQVPKGIRLSVDTVSATVDIQGLDGGKVDVDTVSGKVRANLRSPKVEVDSVSGNIELSGEIADAELQTVSGDIGAARLGDKADLETVSGDVRAGGGPFRKLSVNSVSGDIAIAGALAAGGSIDIDTMSGDVDLTLPANLSATLKASSFSGDIHSDFGQVQEHEHGPGSEISSTLGAGGGSITLESFSGDVRITRQ